MGLAAGSAHPRSGVWLLSRDGYAAMPFDWRGSSVGGPRTAPGRGPAA